MTVLCLVLSVNPRHAPRLFGTAEVVERSKEPRDGKRCREILSGGVMALHPGTHSSCGFLHKTEQHSSRHQKPDLVHHQKITIKSERRWGGDKKVRVSGMGVGSWGKPY